MDLKILDKAFKLAATLNKDEGCYVLELEGTTFVKGIGNWLKGENPELADIVVRQDNDDYEYSFHGDLEEEEQEELLEHLQPYIHKLQLEKMKMLEKKKKPTSKKAKI